VRRLAESDLVVAAEVGAAIWRDAVLEVEDAALLRFARKRPVAMRLVRGLVLTLDRGQRLALQEHREWAHYLT
jgi:hypothetical protein